MTLTEGVSGEEVAARFGLLCLERHELALVPHHGFTAGGGGDK